MSKNILLVDDDVDYVTQMRLQLEAMGYGVSVAASRSEAEHLLAQGRPDLAIVDLMLEHMDAGFTLCYHIKKTDPTIPIIMVTGVHASTGMDFGATTDEEHSWIKADVMLDKPIRWETLRQQINRLLPSA